MNNSVLCNEALLRSYLNNKHLLSESEKQTVRVAIDSDPDCWNLWNKIRWDKAMSTEGVRDLKDFLGAKFTPYYDSSWALAEEWNKQLRKTKEDIEEFYQTTSHYIYNSIIFNYSGDRYDFHTDFKNLKNKYDIQSVIDYGCGVGTDGMMMLDLGLKVTFVDFDSPTLEFLKFRINKRNFSPSQYEIVDVQQLKSKPIQSDLFWSIDVIEHMREPTDIFNAIGEKTRVAAYYSDADDEAGGRHPFHFKINEKVLNQQFIHRSFTNVPHSILKIWKR
jgi:SAM-dependent methyltransferase